MKYIVIMLLLMSSCTTTKREIKSELEKVNIRLPLSFTGYYEIYDFKTNKLIETRDISLVTPVSDRFSKGFRVFHQYYQSNMKSAEENKRELDELNCKMKWYVPSPNYKYYISLFSLFIVPYQAREKIEINCQIYRRKKSLKDYVYSNRLSTTYSFFLLPLLPFVTSQNDVRDQIAKALLQELVDEVMLDYY